MPSYSVVWSSCNVRNARRGRGYLCQGMSEDLELDRSQNPKFGRCERRARTHQKAQPSTRVAWYTGRSDRSTRKNRPDSPGASGRRWAVTNHNSIRSQQIDDGRPPQRHVRQDLPDFFREPVLWATRISSLPALRSPYHLKAAAHQANSLRIAVVGKQCLGNLCFSETRLAGDKRLDIVRDRYKASIVAFPRRHRSVPQRHWRGAGLLSLGSHSAILTVKVACRSSAQQS